AGRRPIISRAPGIGYFSAETIPGAQSLPFKMGLFNFLTQEIAMDLGTANTLIIHNDEIVVNEPSIVALDRNNPKTVLAVGKRALMMHEKTHESIRTVRPLKDGVIADFNAAELMIREMIKMIYPKKPLF